MKYLRFIVMLLLVVGALNWGMVGFFKYNLVGDLLGGEASVLARIVFGLVGIAGLLSLKCLLKCCCGCCGCGSSCSCSCHKSHHDQQQM